MASASPQVAVLDTAEGETALLTAIINARPVGMAKHWAMVSILLYLEQALGEGRVTSTDVWNKLRTLYDLDLLDEDSDLNASNGQSATNEEDPSSNTYSRKRRRRLSTTADTPTTSDPSGNSTKAEFNLLDKRSFQAEFAKRRKSSHSPEPSPFSSSVPMEPDEEEDGSDNREEDEEGEGENTVMVDDDDDDGEEEEEAEEEEEEEQVRLTRGRRGSGRDRPARRGPALGNTKGGNHGATTKARRQKHSDDDAISETASTLSALSEDGEAGSSRRAAGIEEDEEVEVGDRDQKQKDGDGNELDEADTITVADDADSGTEPDIGPDDTPFKTPKGIKKRQQNRKSRKDATSASGEELDDDEPNQDEKSEGERSPTSTRKGARSSKSASKGGAVSNASKRGQPEEAKITKMGKTAPSKAYSGQTYSGSKKKLK